MNQMNFPCNACGACCRHVNGIATLDRGDGVCTYFDEKTNLCTTYESRPLVCNVDKMYDNRYKDTLTPKAYYLVQARSCVDLLPQNQDMPLKTEEALRQAGLYDEGELEDTEKVRSLIVSKLVASDFFLDKAPTDNKSNH